MAADTFIEPQPLPETPVFPVRARQWWHPTRPRPRVVSGPLPRPYRLIVSATGQIGRHKKPRDYGYILCNPDHTLAAGRLVGSGCFVWPGLIAAIRRARMELERPEVRQVSVRTEQDRAVGRLIKWADGRITGSTA